jgi:aldehyde reductase
MEELCKEGKVKSIGLSNFNIEQVDDILNNCEIKPVVNQFEINIYNQNKELINFCQSKGIVVTGYAPLGANDRAWMKPEDPVVLENEIIKRLSQKYNRTAAQICIKWVLQQGAVVLVKSVTASRLEENLNVI